MWSVQGLLSRAALYVSDERFAGDSTGLSPAQHSRLSVPSAQLHSTNNHTSTHAGASRPATTARRHCFYLQTTGGPVTHRLERTHP